MYDWSRLKNYGLWMSIFALIPLILESCHISILPSNYNEIVTAILSILVMAGILSNPTTETRGFRDDKIAPKTLGEISDNTVNRENDNK
ncbi:holin [Clostridium perfringens]|nr:holin [Clostridium perfringens]MDZ4993269.1 holin [Clostridium perfringens]